MPSGDNQRANRVESSFETAQQYAPFRAHLEAAIGTLKDGEPRHITRVHLLAMREMLNAAEHTKTLAKIPDIVPDWRDP